MNEQPPMVAGKIAPPDGWRPQVFGVWLLRALIAGPVGGAIYGAIVVILAIVFGDLSAGDAVNFVILGTGIGFAAGIPIGIVVGLAVAITAMLLTASQLPITDRRAVAVRLRTICGATAAAVAIALVFMINFNVGGSLAEWTLRDMFLVLLPLAAVSFGSIWVAGGVAMEKTFQVVGSPLVE